MKISINSAIKTMVGLHVSIDQETAIRQTRYRGGHPSRGEAEDTLSHAIKGQTYAAKAKVCDIALAMGTGIRNTAIVKALLGAGLEKHGLNFISQGRTGTFGQALSTAAMLSLKIGVLAVGIAVVAPVWGAVSGCLAWQRGPSEMDASSPDQGDPQTSFPRRATRGEGQRHPASSERMAGIVRRHNERGQRASLSAAV